MTGIEQRVPEYVLEALRDPKLRCNRRFHAGAVYAEVWAYLNFETPMPAKVREIADVMNVENARVIRRALSLLVRHRYLVFSHKDSKGIGHYVKRDRRGSQRPPLASFTTDDGT